MTKLVGAKIPALVVLVDIARTIGAYGYSSGPDKDSLDEYPQMLIWADEFQAIFEKNPDGGETYMEDVDEFAIAKAIEAGWTTERNSADLLQFVLKNGLPMERDGKFRYHGLSEVVWWPTQNEAIQSAIDFVGLNRSQTKYVAVKNSLGLKWVSHPDSQLTSNRPSLAHKFTSDEAFEYVERLKKLGFQGLSIVDEIPEVEGPVTRNARISERSS